MSGKAAVKQSEPTREQYETLIGILEEQTELQEKTIAVLEKQIEVLQYMLKSAESKLKDADQKTRITYVMS